MRDGQPFVEVARQQGYEAAAAERAQAEVVARLQAGGLCARRYYCFRTRGVGGGNASQAPSRPRLLLLFRDADDALSFAQASSLGAAPRLMVLSLAQALSMLLQRPAIGALYLAASGEVVHGGGGLPPGVRVERGELLAMLVTPAG
jgi:hypothetical protein